MATLSFILHNCRQRIMVRGVGCIYTSRAVWHEVKTSWQLQYTWLILIQISKMCFMAYYDSYEDNNCLFNMMYFHSNEFYIHAHMPMGPTQP